MTIPEITPLQFMVLCILKPGPLFGKYLREELEKNEHKTSLPAFYQMMSRMEDAGLVQSTPYDEFENGFAVRKNNYSATQLGHSEREHFLKFATEAWQKTK